VRIVRRNVYREKYLGALREAQPRGFQAGLSWLTILRKREAFRQAFAGFDFERIARFGERDVDRLPGRRPDRGTAARSRRC
jgi:3-methyladenine DNA glycosylase Tag